jgi:protein-S-isoprenylcysteine O-methyltransferase Ste14
MLGSALVTGPAWLAIFVVMGVYCVYSARTEERLMLQQFPEQYPQYKGRTKALIPFVI